MASKYLGLYLHGVDMVEQHQQIEDSVAVVVEDPREVQQDTPLLQIMVLDMVVLLLNLFLLLH